jgi:hypothetical protein
MSYRTAEAAGASLGTVPRILALRAFRRKYRAGRGVKRLVAHPGGYRPLPKIGIMNANSGNFVGVTS